MRIFKINDRIEVVCDNQNTRYGFRHLATLFIDGNEAGKAKACYYNRTWESYEFQTVLSKVVANCTALSEDEKKACKEFIDKDHTDWSEFKMVSNIAKLGEALCQTQKEKNDWKARMIKAGLGDRGLTMSEDWDTLDEDTKQARLDAVIQELDK